MSKPILILNGPNLNRLGLREPEVYGRETLDELNQRLRDYAGQKSVALEFAQSNHEGELIDRIHAAAGTMRGIIINPGGLTHTSVALRDAVASISIPVIEVHISNIFSREPFRHQTMISGACVGMIGGLGTQGYFLAVDYLLSLPE
ncbi:MAG: type II 3-dehydroquinate dehydratase [Candidatus Zixiibacteriota bacterium]